MIWICSFVGVAQPMTEVRIVKEDQQSVELEFKPHITALQIRGTQGTIFTRYSFYESQTSYDSSGRVDFRRTLLLLLPSPQYSLQVLDGDFTIQDSIKLLPQPTRISREDLGISEVYDDSSYNKVSDLLNQNILADFGQIGKYYTGYIGPLQFHPIQAIAKGKVRIYSRIVVRITFNQALPLGLSSSSILKGDWRQTTQTSQFLKQNIQQATLGDSPLAQGDWYRLDIQDAGMYKLDYNYFQRMNIAVSNINSVRIFGNGGQVIPDNISEVHPDSLVEISRLVVDNNGNGVFDSDDYILFYGRGVMGWNYRGSNIFEHYINPYTSTNFYFLTVTNGTGKLMDTVSAAAVSSPTLQPANFQEKIFVEEERFNLLNSGRQWVGRLFSGTGNAETYSQPLPGLVSTSPISYKFRFVHRSTTSDYMNIYENDQLLLSGYMYAFYTTDENSKYAEAQGMSASRTGGVPNNLSNVRMQLGSTNQDAKAWLDWMEIYYQRKFEATNDVLIYTTPDASGIIQYTISNFSGGVRAFDVTDHGNIKELKFSSTDSTTCVMQIQQTTGSVRQIAVIGRNGIKTVPNALRIGNTINLHSPLKQYDFIIISPPEFLSEANRLAAYRESHDTLRTLVVDINQIYSEFSGGLVDPLAIREFLRYARTKWTAPAPQFVLLFGWGHCDYKNISTSQRNWIPPYETLESLDAFYSYPTDDKFVMLNLPGETYSYAIGRIPARSVQEASIVVSKIISYENNAPVDPWRNRMTYVADDGKTSQGDDGNQYTVDSDNLAEIYTPKSCEKNKIYLVEYPTVISMSGRRKPTVNTAIVDAFNQGTLIVNFIGHGNDRIWTHEAVFTREEDLPQLSNKNRLSLVVASTCSYGRYDNPNILSGAEQLVTMDQGGAVASLATARSVNNGPNVSLNNSLFVRLFTKDSDGKNPRVGAALQLAKIANNNSNTQKFHLFGDPTLRLLIPENVSSIDSVNGNSTDGATVKIQSLSNVIIKGTMKNNQGTPLTSFQGKGILQLFDSQREMNIQDGIDLFTFKVNGSLLYRGSVTVNNGQFTCLVPIPKDVTFGNKSRISLYAWNEKTDGVGYTENIMVNGIDSTAAVDSLGPQIAVYLDDLNFRAGDIVKSNPTLIVRLSDASGINTSTVGVGHQISASLNNAERTYDLSNYYQSDLDTYTSGEARYTLRDLSDGKYSLKVKAWDIQNNSSESETYFEVHTSSEDMALLNMMNYPNPFSSTTTFFFQRNAIDPINVEIKIYSIAGRLIVNLEALNVTERSVRIPWDGTDREGASLANGLYLYKVKIQGLNDQRTNETIGKLVIMR